MKDVDIIQALRGKLAVPMGRHLYAVLGPYAGLDAFSKKLRQAKTPDDKNFPAPLSVNRGILDAIPESEFRRVVEDEARRPEPTAAHVAQAFSKFIRESLKNTGIVVLNEFELLVAYRVDWSVFRTLATDQDRVVLLLAGKRESGRIALYPDYPEGSYTLPNGLIAHDHLWELSD